VLTRLWPLETRLFQDCEITAEHLLASCAVLGLLPQRRIDGALYSDGGLLEPLPLAAAVAMGADRIIAVDCWQTPPVLRAALAPLRKFGKTEGRRTPPGIKVISIASSRQLGPLKYSWVWKREYVERWMEEGARDASAAVELLKE
jgi:predicted acylesterase/phospholipase RssA